MSPEPAGNPNESREEQVKGLVLAVVISAVTFLVCFGIAYSGYLWELK